MYAIIEAGGAQHKVTEGQVIRVNDPNLPVGEEVSFDKVKAFSDGEQLLVGRPDLADVTVSGLVQKEIKGPKVRIHKYRPRKHSDARMGHRQRYSLVKISKIVKA